MKFLLLLALAAFGSALPTVNRQGYKYGLSDIVPIDRFDYRQLYGPARYENVFYHQQGYEGFKYPRLPSYNYPVRDYDVLLQQIQQQRQFQNEFGHQYSSPRYFHDIEQELSHQQLLEEIYGEQQHQQYPLNPFLVNLKLSNGQREYLVPEQFYNEQQFKQIVYEQELINELIVKKVVQQLEVPQDLVYRQRLVNEKIYKVVKQLVQHQEVIDRQIEQLIQTKQVVPKELVYQQRLVYQQVHEVLKGLVAQQIFIQEQIQHLIELRQVVHQEFFVQQRILFEQIQTLIQGLLVEPLHLRQQLLVLIKEGQYGEVVPQELVYYQKLSYKHVEQFIQVLVQQFIQQQNHFYQLFQVYVQQGKVIPEEFISQYFLLHKELQQLVSYGEVSEELIHQQRLFHQQILALIQREKVVPQEYYYQQLPRQQYPLNFLHQENVYQRYPYVY